MYRVEEIRIFDKRYQSNYWVCSIALSKIGVATNDEVEYYISLVNTKNNETISVNASSILELCRNNEIVGLIVLDSVYVCMLMSERASLLCDSIQYNGFANSLDVIKTDEFLNWDKNIRDANVTFVKCSKYGKYLNIDLGRIMNKYSVNRLYPYVYVDRDGTAGKITASDYGSVVPSSFIDALLLYGSKFAFWDGSGWIIRGSYIGTKLFKFGMNSRFLVEFI